MINADQQHLEMLVRKRTAEIRTKEVNLFVKNFQTMGTASTLLCGLGFSCLYMKPDYLYKVNPYFGWRRDIDAAQCIFALISVAAIGCSMMVMATSAYCIIFGMDLAVRGEEGSVTVAAERLYEERHFVLRVFWVAVVLTLLSGISLAYVKLHVEARYTTIVILSIFGVFIAWYLRFRARENFKFPAHFSKKPEGLNFSRSQLDMVGKGYNAEIRPPSPMRKKAGRGSRR